MSDKPVDIDVFDADEARAIVMSARTVFSLFAQKGMKPDVEYLRQIIFAEDEGTQAMIAALKSE